MNKRMCETFAFYHYDKWWQDQEEKFKQKTQKTSLATATSTSTSTTSATVKSEIAAVKSESTPPVQTKTEDLSSIFDKQREKLESAAGSVKGFGFGGSLGIGFRGTIPKLPSFKKKESSSDYRSNRHDHRKSSKSLRKEQERRREERKQKDRKAVERDPAEKKPEAKTAAAVEQEQRPKKTEKMEKKNTLESIYSAIYSSDDESDVERAEKEDKKKKRKEKEEKATVKKKISASAESSAISASESSESEEESSGSSSSEGYSPSSDSESVSSAAAASSASSSSSSSSEEDEELTALRKKVVKPKKKALAKSSSDEKMDVDNDDEDDVDVEGDVEEPVSKTAKKPVPQRRPSAAAGAAVKDEEEEKENNEEEVESPSHIADHCYARPFSELEEAQKSKAEPDDAFVNDHGYTTPRTPPTKAKETKKPLAVKQQPQQQQQQQKPPSVLRKRPDKVYKARDRKEQYKLLYRFLSNGLDLEDIGYLKRSYEMMLNQQAASEDQKSKTDLYWLNDTHWVNHPVTDIAETPRKRRRGDGDYSKKHVTGCARSEGFYKMDPREKRRTKYHLHRADAADAFAQAKFGNVDGSATKGKVQTAQSHSREARSMQRRQLAVLGDEVASSDLLKFNQLKVSLTRLPSFMHHKFNTLLIAVPSETNEVRQVCHPRLGFIRVGGHRCGRNGHRVRGPRGSPRRVRCPGKALRETRHRLFILIQNRPRLRRRRHEEGKFGQIYQS